VVLPPAPVVDRRPAQTAIAWAGAALLVGIGCVAIGQTLIQGRRRRWSTAPPPGTAVEGD
jgi:hypothetical protein